MQPTEPTSNCLRTGHAPKAVRLSERTNNVSRTTRSRSDSVESGVANNSAACNKSNISNDSSDDTCILRRVHSDSALHPLLLVHPKQSDNAMLDQPLSDINIPDPLSSLPLSSLPSSTSLLTLPLMTTAASTTSTTSTTTRFSLTQLWNRHRPRLSTLLVIAGSSSSAASSSKSSNSSNNSVNGSSNRITNNGNVIRDNNDVNFNIPFLPTRRSISAQPLKYKQTRVLGCMSPLVESPEEVNDDPGSFNAALQPPSSPLPPSSRVKSFTTVAPPSITLSNRIKVVKLPLPTRSLRHTGLITTLAPPLVPIFSHDPFMSTPDSTSSKSTGTVVNPKSTLLSSSRSHSNESICDSLAGKVTCSELDPGSRRGPLSLASSPSPSTQVSTTDKSLLLLRHGGENKEEEDEEDEEDMEEGSIIKKEIQKRIDESQEQLEYFVSHIRALDSTRDQLLESQIQRKKARDALDEKVEILERMIRKQDSGHQDFFFDPKLHRLYCCGLDASVRESTKEAMTGEAVSTSREKDGAYSLSPFSSLSARIKNMPAKLAEPAVLVVPAVPAAIMSPMNSFHTTVSATYLSSSLLQQQQQEQQEQQHQQQNLNSLPMCTRCHQRAMLTTICSCLREVQDEIERVQQKVNLIGSQIKHIQRTFVESIGKSLEEDREEWNRLFSSRGLKDSNSNGSNGSCSKKT